jgi:hypothetical protein
VSAAINDGCEDVGPGEGDAEVENSVSGLMSDELSGLGGMSDPCV